MLRVVLIAWVLATAGLAAQTVDGHVVDSETGADIPRVDIDLLQAGGIGYSARTDSQGRFRFEAVNDGTYTAHYYEKAGRYWSVPNLLDVAVPPSFQVATGGEPVHLEAKMHPIPKVSGQVLDAMGRPVPNASVWASRQNRWCNTGSCFSRSKEVKTDEEGKYSFTDLDHPGIWLLSAASSPSWVPPESRDDPQLILAETFFPGVTDPQLAERILVQPGVDLWNMDIKLSAVRGHRIRGRVLDARSDPLAEIPVALFNAFGPTFHQSTKADGTFEFGSIADGEWRISSTLDQGSVRLCASQSVQLKGHDLESIELRLNLPFSIHGKLILQVPNGVPAPKPPKAIILSYAGAAGLENRPGVPTTKPDENGDFTIQNLYSGLYEVFVPEPPPAPFYLDSIRLGNLDAPAPDVPIVSEAQLLTVTYKFGGGTVRGTIEACQTARVLLVPVDPALLRREFVYETSCGPNDDFEFAGVRPGEYYGIAVASDSSARWYTDVLDYGQLNLTASRVRVRGNEYTTAEIRLIRW
jgi:uncharacterized GH25 family protein